MYSGVRVSAAAGCSPRPSAIAALPTRRSQPRQQPTGRRRGVHLVIVSRLPAVTRQYELDIATAKQSVDWKKAVKLLKEVEGKNIPMTESMVSDALYTICYGAAPAQAAKEVIDIASNCRVDVPLADLDLAAIVFARDGRVELAEELAARVGEPSMRMLYSLADMAKRTATASAIPYVLRCARDAGVDDQKLFGTCIIALANAGQLDEAVAELRALPAALPPQGAQVYTALAGAARNANLDDLADELEAEMDKKCTEW